MKNVMKRKRLFITYTFCLITFFTFSQENKYFRENRFHPSRKLKSDIEMKFQIVQKGFALILNPELNTKMNDSIKFLYEVYKNDISVYNTTFVLLKSGLKMSISPFLPPQNTKNKKCTEEFKNRQKYLEFCKAWKKQKKTTADFLLGFSLIDKYYKKIEYYNQEQKVAEFIYVFDDKIGLKLLD